MALRGGVTPPTLLPPGMPALPDGGPGAGRPGALGEGKLGGMTAVPPPLLPATPALSNGKLGEDNFGEGDVWACAADSVAPAITRASGKVLFMEPSDADSRINGAPEWLFLQRCPLPGFW